MRGGVRFISSRRTTLANTGPGRNSQVAVSGEKTVTPVMSEGSRSGWPWTRDSSAPRAVASARARTVLPTPGTSSISRWDAGQGGHHGGGDGLGGAEEHAGQGGVEVAGRAGRRRQLDPAGPADR